jgi:hypothetical protein
MPPTLMRTLRTLCLPCLLSAALGAQAAVIEGQHFDDRIRLADTELVLNGVGLRAVAWLKGYAAGLYIAKKASTPEAVVAIKGPKRIRMKMMVEVESKEFVKAFDKGMKRNLGEAEFAALTERMLKFDAMVNALVKLKKGDVVDLDYLPSRGLVLSLNGVAKGEALPGEDLYAGLLKIFIGTRPVDTRLKAGLLGET